MHEQYADSAETSELFATPQMSAPRFLAGGGEMGALIRGGTIGTATRLEVLFTTGYSRNAIVHQGRLDAGVQLITKPFTFDQLATRVRDLLDQPA